MTSHVLEIAATPDDAIKIANQIGYPVVLKIASPDILHKTDVGGVKVDLSNSEEVFDAFELMVYRAQRYVPEARIWGCLVQEMVPAGGLEVLVGMNRDPQFGPLVTFGLGGILCGSTQRCDLSDSAIFAIGSRSDAG